MKFASPYAVVAGILIAGVFVARAAIGVPAGLADAHGGAAEAAGRFAEASELWDRAAVGENLTGVLWRSGRSLMRSWRQLPTAERLAGPGDEVLRAAAVRYLKGRAASPGSAWFTAGLGDVYKLRERTARQLRVVDVETLSRGPWALVGDDGRIAIGLTRAAIDREPTNFENRDQLVFLLEENGLHVEALTEMAESARVLPDFVAHPDFVFEELPLDLVETFWRTSRAVPPEEVPLLSPGRKLVSAGILGRRLGHLAEAETDLRAALNGSGTIVLRAEASFYLGLVLADLGRFDDAETMLAQALRWPAFGPGVAEARARMAMKQERWPVALAQLREARRLQPRELWILLDFARVAQKTKSWDQAEEALRWAILVHPESPEPRRQMVGMFLDQGEKVNARRALDEYVAAFGKSEDAAQMEQALAGSLDPARR
jgi:tetratricopeptide (TPR) repeat protein